MGHATSLGVIGAHGIGCTLEHVSRKLGCMRRNICRPIGQYTPESRDITRKQRTCCFLEFGEISAQCTHESIRRFLRRSQLFLVIALRSRPIDESSQRCGCAARLPVEPLPMPWKQGDFTRNDAKLAPTRAAPGFRNLFG